MLSVASDRVLLSLVESAPDGMMLVDSTGRISIINRQIEVLFGYPRDELIGQPVEHLLPERFRAGHVADRTHYAKVGEVRLMGAGLDLRARRADGTEFPVEISLSPVTTAGEHYVIASVRDITDRVALEAQAALVQSTVDAAHDGVFMFDPDTLQFTYVNHGAVQQTGYSKAELLEMTPLDLKPLFTKDEFLDLIAPLMNGQRSSLEFRTIHRTKSSVDVPVEIILEFPVVAHPSSPKVLVAVARDITDRDAFERQLLDSEAAFRSAFDDAPVGMLTASIDSSGKRTIERANQAFCQLVGYSPDELVGMDLRLLAHPDDEAADTIAAAEMSRGGRTFYETEKRYRQRDGTFRWALLHSKVLSHRYGVRVLAHVLDISDRRANEAERDRQQRLHQAVAELRAHLLNEESITETLDVVNNLARSLIEADNVTITTFTGGLNNSEVLSTTSTSRCFPLVFDDTRRVVVVTTAEGQPTVEDVDLRTIESFVQQAETSIQLAIARRDRERLALFEDRERIARDLHDVVIQRIFAAGLGLESLRTQVSPASAAQKIQATVDQLDSAMRELRSTIFGLNTFEARIPIDKQLHDLIESHHETLGFQPHVVLDEHIESVPLVVIEQLIPTLNEALSNVARHANATSADIVIDITDDHLVLTVTDNGKGIDAEVLRGKGLTNLERRAHRLGGSGEVNKAPDGGTKLRWQVPV